MAQTVLFQARHSPPCILQFSTVIPRVRLSVPAILFALALSFASTRELRAAVDLVEQFEKEVRPVLAEQCFKCHGPEKQKGGLRMDRKAGLLSGGDSGEPALSPGKSADSSLVARIVSLDPDQVMPPKGDRLKPEQVAAIKRWIDNGAHWPDSGKPEPEAAIAKTGASPGMIITDKDRDFWSFKVPTRATTTAVKPGDRARQPIDIFIAAKLRENGLVPSPEAPRAVLIRRMSYDITGLPPTPAEVDA